MRGHFKGVGQRVFILSISVGMLIVGIQGVNAQSARWQSQDFIESIEGSSIDFQFIREGLESVSSIRESSDGSSLYRPATNVLQLTKRVMEPGRRIRNADDINEGDVGVIAHEALHAFRANRIQEDPAYLEWRRWIKSSAQTVFGKVPRDQREIALEEAYASFIQIIVSVRMHIDEMIQKIDSVDEALCTQRLTSYEKIWKGLWSQRVEGYYYRDPNLFDFIEGKLVGRPYALMDKNTSIDQDGTVYVHQTNLPRADRRWIAENLLEGRVSSSFSKTFQSVMADSTCSAVAVNLR